MKIAVLIYCLELNSPCCYIMLITLLLLLLLDTNTYLQVKCEQVKSHCKHIGPPGIDISCASRRFSLCEAWFDLLSRVKLVPNLELFI